MKKSLIPLICIIIFSSIIIAQNYNIDISIISENALFQPGQNIDLKINLYGPDNSLINEQIEITLEDFKGNIIQKQTISSNIVNEIKLDENALYGEAKIIAKYQDAQTQKTFFVGEKKLAEFKIEGEKLIVTNIGNSVYNKKVYISIGGTTGTQTPNLDIGESASYRLIAPKGEYRIKVWDNGASKTLEVGDIKLTGTGNAIAAIDESTSQRTGITGGISPDEKSEIAILSYIKNSKFVYVFIVVIFGAMILLAIEKQYKKKVKK